MSSEGGGDGEEDDDQDSFRNNNIHDLNHDLAMDQQQEKAYDSVLNNPNTMEDEEDSSGSSSEPEESTSLLKKNDPHSKDGSGVTPKSGYSIMTVITEEDASIHSSEGPSEILDETSVVGDAKESDQLLVNLAPDNADLNETATNTPPLQSGKKTVDEVEEQLETGEDIEVEASLKDELLDLAANAAPMAASAAYESTSYAQPPKLEVIDEHEILETPAPAVVPTSVTVASPTGDEEFGENGLGFPGGTTSGGSTQPHFTVELDQSNSDLDKYASGTPRESVDYLGEEARPPHLSEPALPKNYTEPSNLNIFRRVGTFTRRLFGSTTVTPSDSLVSLEFAVSQTGIGGSHTGHHRISRRGGNMSSRNSVSSEASSLQVPTFGIRKSSAGNRRRPPVAPPTGEVLSRSRRFLRGGTGGFLHAKGTSAISLRPPEPNQGLPSPCGECPHCRKFLKMGEPGIPLRALGQSCPCRICTILEENTPGAPTRLTKQAANRGKTPGGLGDVRTLKPSLPSDYGIFCEACNQSGYMSPEGRCCRMGSVQGSVPSEMPGLNPNVIITGNIVDQPSEAPSMDSLATNLGRQLSIRDQACQVSRQLSMTSVGTSGPVCRICHSPADKEEPLISPCRCSGTLKYVHMSCLVHWLEISCRKLRKPPQCELCGYRYQRRKILKLRNCSWPKCCTKDKVLHSIFVLSVLAMIFCAAVTIICFKAEKRDAELGNPQGSNVNLSAREVVTLICGVMFFCAFFVAMYVQVKAQTTIYKLVIRFWLMNHEWFVDEYRPEKDPEYIRRQKIREAAIEAAKAKQSALIEETGSICKDEDGNSRRITDDDHFEKGSDREDLDSISATFHSSGEEYEGDSEEERDFHIKQTHSEIDLEEGGSGRTSRVNSRASRISGLVFHPKLSNASNSRHDVGT